MSTMSDLDITRQEFRALIDEVILSYGKVENIHFLEEYVKSIFTKELYAAIDDYNNKEQ